MEPNPDALGAARREIDETDRELLRLLARRFEAVRLVAGAKAEDGEKPIMDNDRERGVLAAWIRDAEDLGLSTPFARRILKEILNHSRRLQEPLVEASPARARKVKVGYQGVLGSYSAQASAHLMATRSASGAELVGTPCSWTWWRPCSRAPWTTASCPSRTASAAPSPT